MFRIGLDPKTNTGNSWYLDKVVVVYENMGQQWLFPCRRWFSRDEDDGQIVRELEAQQMTLEQNARGNKLTTSDLDMERVDKVRDNDILNVHDIETLNK